MKELVKDLLEKKETETYSHFQDYQYWLESQGIPERTKRNIQMNEGNQWANATERTKKMPRPVYNVYSYLLDTKEGNILGSPMHINYISDSTRDITNKFTRVSEYLRKEAKEEEHDSIAVRNALLQGTSFKYYYFSENAIGKKGEYKGGVRIENIDIDDIAFSDPSDSDVQSQKWIIIRNRVDVETAKKMCDDEKRAELITTDEIDNSIYEDAQELNKSKMVYVYTEMCRIDGEVYFKKTTKDVMIHDYIPLNPKILEDKYKKKIEEVAQKEKNLENDLQNKVIDAKIVVDQDSNLEKSNKSKGYKAYLYPINELTFKKKNKSIIGIPEFNDIIEAQKTINSNQGMATLNNLQMAAPKYVVKESALQGQVITNSVGETIVDHTPAGQDGIKILQGQPITTGAFQLAPGTLEYLKTIKGASDVITGETSSKDLSGYAIAQLAAQSQKPIALLQKSLWRHKEREAEIFRQFIILFYNEKTEYKYKLSETEQMQNELGNIEESQISEYHKDEFVGSEFENFEFDVQVEVGAGTQYSEIQEIAQLDSLLQAGFIDFATYVDLYPDKAMVYKRQLKEFVKLREQSENAQLKQQLATVNEQLQQLAEYSSTLESQNNDYKAAVKDLQNMVKDLTTEYTGKINQANKIIQETQTKQDTKTTNLE